MRIDQNKENAMTFWDFMEGVRNEDSPVGDLANDAIGDEKFPWQEAERENGKAEIFNYLRYNLRYKANACQEVVQSRTAWSRYLRAVRTSKRR